VELEQLLQRSSISPTVLSVKYQIHFDLRENPSGNRCNTTSTVSFPAPRHSLMGYAIRPGYDVNQFKRRLGDHRARYFILRPDSIIYAAARNLQDLERCIGALEQSV
jgi:hypothetical protein